MSTTGETASAPDLTGLPETVQRGLGDFLAAARSAFSEDLLSVVLFGSGAEGRLRRTSDVNLILVLGRFERTAADALREPLRIAQAAIALNAMFLRADEVALAAEAFALKFSDVLRRRRVLYGQDPFASLAIPRAAQLARLKQVLLNLELRLRAFYVERSLREEQLTRVLAEEAGPLRAAAATLLELEGGPALPPKQALERVAGQAGDFAALLEGLSRAREDGRLAPGEAPQHTFRLFELVEAIEARLARLEAGGRA